MSLRKKVLGIALAGALLGAAGAAYGERVRTDDPPAQSAPAQPRVQHAPRAQTPPAIRPQAPPRVSPQAPSAPKQPDTRAYQPPAKPRAEQPPRMRQRLPEETPDQRYRPGTARPPVLAPRPPGTNDHHRPGYHRPPPNPQRHYRDWNDCRYDPWWQHRWSHWDTPRFSIFVGWPYWDTWGWDDRRAYRAYERSGSVDTFQVMPPLGYERAVVAYFRGADEDTIRVELEREAPWGGIELVVLRDEGADGDLESAIYASGRNRDAALTNYQFDGGNQMLPRLADRLYSQVFDDILDEIRTRD